MGWAAVFDALHTPLDASLHANSTNSSAPMLGGPSVATPLGATAVTAWLTLDELIGKAAGGVQAVPNASVCPDLVPWTGEELLPSGQDVGYAAAWMTWLRSIYFNQATMVVVVIGDVTPTNLSETVYCILLILLGLSVNSWIIGYIVGIIAK